MHRDICAGDAYVKFCDYLVRKIKIVKTRISLHMACEQSPLLNITIDSMQ